MQIWGLRIGRRPVALLSIPLLGTLLTEAVQWGLMDFVVGAGLVFGTTWALERLILRADDLTHRTAYGVAVVSVFLLLWTQPAVGLVGSADHPAGMLVLAVLGVIAGGSAVAQLRPPGMAVTFATAAILQALLPAVAVAIRRNPGTGLVPLIGPSAFFAVLFGVSSWLFRRVGDRPDSDPVSDRSRAITIGRSRKGSNDVDV